MAPIFSLRYRVWWSETDAAIMMHFSNFFRVCERTEEEFLSHLGVAQVGQPGSRLLMPRVRAECDYESPLRPGDMYRVDIVDIVLGRTSIQYSYEVYNETRGRLSARCRIVTVIYDEATDRPKEIPAELRNKLLASGARQRDDSSR
mgnify:CR=1 FL=1